MERIDEEIVQPSNASAFTDLLDTINRLLKRHNLQIIINEFNDPETDDTLYSAVLNKME